MCHPARSKRMCCFLSSRRRHTRCYRDWSSDVCSSDLSNWRSIAHRISDEIYQRLTGEQGYFNTQIVYIAEQGAQNRRIKRLSIMDQDGENHRFLTSGNELVLTPRFSPSSREITYMAYQSNGRSEGPRVSLFNLNTGQQEVLGDFPGMTF